MAAPRLHRSVDLSSDGAAMEVDGGKVGGPPAESDPSAWAGSAHLDSPVLREEVDGTARR